MNGGSQLFWRFFGILVIMIHIFASCNGDVKTAISVKMADGASPSTMDPSSLTFAPPEGTYTEAQSVTISSSISGAKIYYTTDGSVPTLSSPVYSDAIQISASTTINALVTKSGSKKSVQTSAVYTIHSSFASSAAEAPQFTPSSGTYASAQTITLSSATSGASIYYTTDGSTPTTSSSIYSGAISVPTTQTLKAIAVKSGFTVSSVVTAAFTINGAVATPTFTPSAGAYGPTQSVTITSATSGATIYYTTDGSTPTSSSTLYSGAISVATTQTIKALAVKSGYLDSTVTTTAYTINGAAAAPTFSLGSGAYGPTQSVTLSSSTVGATIYYTTNGSTPTTSSTVYSGTISVASTQTIKAIAVKATYSDSSVASATYTINGSASTPTFSPAAGSFSSVQSVTISSATAGVTIYYTIDGSEPTISSTLYTGAISVSSPTTIKSLAVKSAYSDSSVASAAYSFIAPTCANTVAASRTNDCYNEGTSPNYAQDLAIGTMRAGPDGTILILQYVNGSSGFKVWIESGGTRILNATGMVSNGWQKTLARAGTSFTTSNFTSASSIAGRACPPNVFLNFSNMVATGRCLYYDEGVATPDGLDSSEYYSGGIHGEDWIGGWGPGDGTPTGSSYYEGNVRPCANKGMRLPTMYETNAGKPGSDWPTGDGLPSDPTWADGVPDAGGLTYTASASLIDMNSNSEYWGWSGAGPSSLNYHIGGVLVRCVLP